MRVRSRQSQSPCQFPSTGSRMGALRAIRDHVRSDGLVETAAICPALLRNRLHAWYDDARDRCSGIDTRGILEPHDIDNVGQNGAHSTGHEPIQRLCFAQMLRFSPVEYTQYTFVDFGSGKGRAVLLAARFPFRQVLGIEFSPTLHRAALRNVARFRALHTEAVPIELRCEDAALSQLPRSPLLCFFYNPFGEVVMRKVLQNLRCHPRPLRILYRNPVWASLMDESPFLILKTATPAFRIYEKCS